MFTWIRLQSEVTRWVEKNFPGAPPSWQMWGLIEEAGELEEARVISAMPAFGKVVHSHLKKQQGIRGSAEKHIAAGRDAVADSFVFFMHACSSLGWAAQDVLHSQTPDEFQMTFSVPPGRSPITHVIKHLARLVECLEDVELADKTHTDYESTLHAHVAGAKSAALSYLSGLAAYCTQMGWSLQEIIDEVWPKVRQRDWTKNKVTGGDLDAPKLDLHAKAVKEMHDQEDAEVVRHIEGKIKELEDAGPEIEVEHDKAPPR